MNNPKAYSYIRFSSPEQEKGDSIRRQIEQSEEYAKQNGLILDDSLKLTDRGLSAFHGMHRTKGALGTFLKLVEAGKIEKGSTLIVENMDRLSREQIMGALTQFISIINAGITLVTLQDGMAYSKESITKNWTQLIVSITYMARAHEESATKAKRLSAAWKNKRESIQDKPMTAKVPSWVKLSEDRKKFILIPEVVKAVAKIFRMKADGKSTYMIERDLNADPDIWKPLKSGRNSTGGWRTSYITKILRSRAVIGEFQPHTVIDRKRQPIGDPIIGYYPAVIDEDLFHHVQNIIKSNGNMKGKGGGRTGKANNLFTHIAVCGLCKSPLHFIDKGSSKGRRQYLECDSARRLKTCPAKTIRYDEFEKLFFDNFEELDLSALVPGNGEIESRLNMLKITLSANEERLSEIEGEIENLTETIATTKDSRVRKSLDKRLTGRFDEQERLKAENISHNQEMDDLRRQKENLQENIDKAMEIYSLLDSTRDEERVALRLKLRREIKTLIDRIDVYPLQEKFTEIEEVEPGIIKHMKSKYIDKVRIKFKGSRKLRLLYLKRYGEIV